ncbi:MAG: hypothetical protein KF715_06685 [Candidatus Didemnitutus sp.]|nr:hypothetical protein [Candidatus Didemnitutus sp.]
MKPENASLPVRVRWHLADLVIILTAPLAAWWLFRIKMFMQIAYADPWFYTGAGQEWVQLAKHYGWAYYYVRFPVMFLNTVFCNVPQPDVGFMLLRYLLIVLSGGALYALALSRFGRASAIASFAFLFLNPQFISVLNWDLTPFLSVPATLAGASLWLYRGRAQFVRSFVSGALFCVAVNCHIFTITAVGCFVAGVAVSHAWCRSSWRNWLTEFGGALIGFAAMWTIGWLYYRGIFGASANYLLFWDVNWRTLRTGSDYAISHAVPFQRWWNTHTYVYVPYLLLLAGLLTSLRRRSWTAHDYAVVTGPVFLLTFYFVYRFGLQCFVFEEGTYFGHIWALTPLLVAVVAGSLESELRAWRGWSAVAAAVLVPLVLTVWGNQTARTIWPWLAQHRWPVVLTLLCGVVAAVVAIKASRSLIRWIAFAVLVCAAQVLSLIPAVGNRMYGSPDEEHQRAVYLAATQYTHRWGTYARSGEPPLLWFSSSSSDYDIYSVAFATLGNTLHNIWNVSGMPEFGEFERKRLAEQRPKVLFLLGKRAEEIAAGKESLTRSGLALVTIENAMIGTEKFPILLEVVRLSPR